MAGLRGILPPHSRAHRLAVERGTLATEHSIRFTSEDWDRIERDYSAWWAGELDRPLVYLTGTDPDAQLPVLNRFFTNYPPSVSAEELCARFEARFRAQSFYGDAFPHWFIDFGPGILAGLLGAQVHSKPETVWFEPVEIRLMKDIVPRFDPDGFWWKRIIDVTRAACEYWDGIIAVSHTALCEGLDVLASLRTTEGLLLDLADAAREVERVLWETSAIWRNCYDKLSEIIAGKCRGTVSWAPLWSPKRTDMLQCDLSCMVSPAMFERFVLPELTAACDFLDHPFYHLDGPGALPHLDMLLSIPSLRGIQWVPGATNPWAAHWPDVLRRIRAAGKLCQIWVRPEEAIKVIREIGGRGFQFLVAADMKSDEAQAFLGELEEAGRSGYPVNR